jgi:hypothetical protein
MAGRIARGWGFAKLSLRIVRSDPALVALAGIGIVLAVVVAAGPLIGAAVLSENDETFLSVVLLVVGVYVFSAATAFFGVAIAWAASRVLDGMDATVGGALRFAASRIGPILAWALVGTAVTVLIELLRSRAGAAGQVLAGLGGAAWGLVSFLAIPVIAFENLGPLATLKRSASLFRLRWGEQATGSVSIGLVFVLLMIPAAIVVGIGAGIASSNGNAGWIVAALGALVIAILGIVARAASATFGTVLYRFAATGQTSGPFTESDLRDVARQRALA